jgi:pimeloyl-ACP methyl ester carboxylesterase
MGDVRAVLDAVRSSSTVLLGSQDGCSMAALFAATYPERTRALALFHPIVHFPHGEIEGYEASLALLRDRWGTQEHSDEMLSWNAL